MADGDRPFVSPDGQWVGFIDPPVLKKWRSTADRVSRQLRGSGGRVTTGRCHLLDTERNPSRLDDGESRVETAHQSHECPDVRPYLSWAGTRSVYDTRR